MAMYATVYLNGAPLLISPVEGQYGVSTNSDGKKEWSISIHAAKGLIEENIDMIPHLHGRKTYIDVDGTSHAVTVSNDMDGDVSTVAAVDITLTEDGYNEESSSSDAFDPEIKGLIYSRYGNDSEYIPFVAKMSDLTTTFNTIGQYSRGLTGALLQPNYAMKYRSFSLSASLDTEDQDFGRRVEDYEWFLNDFLATIGPGSSVLVGFWYRDANGVGRIKEATGTVTSSFSCSGLKFDISFEIANAE